MTPTSKKAYLWATCLTLTVTSLGALTRLTDSGLGCPDWPGCYGAWLAPLSTTPLNSAYFFNAWMEMIHRYGAGLLSLTLLALLIQQCLKKPLKNPWPLYGASCMIILQATLGMLTVTMTLRPWVVSAHLLGGLSTLALIYACTLQHYPRPKLPQKPRLIPIYLALLFVFIQIALGAWTSTHYATLACTDLPFCNPDTYHSLMQAWQDFKPTTQSDFQNLAITIKAAIQQWHRIGAHVLALYLSALSVYTLLRYRTHKSLQITALLLLALIILQMSLGMAMVLLERPLWLAWGHHVVATAILLTCLTQLYYLKAPTS